MSVFDKYQIGSFRGVEFLWSESDGDLGRRVQVHEYPGRTDPYVEDLGGRARSWSMDLIVAGPSYMAARDRLAAALSQAGPGVLIHPTHGELKVSVYEARGPRESTREGGMARFAVIFIRAGENRYPTAAADGRRIVADRCDAAEAAMGAWVSARLAIDGPGFIADDAVTQVQKIAATIHKTVVGLPELAGSTAIMQAVQTLSTIAASLIRDPIDLCGSINTILGDIVTAAERPLLAFAALRTFWGFLPAGDDIPLTTASRLAQSENRAALSDFFVAAATTASARAASAADYDSQNAADAASAAIRAQIDVVVLSAADDLYNSLSDLAAAIVADLGTRPGLPSLVNVTLTVDLPALAMAQRLYGDAARAEDIVARNRVAHPGFVPGGRTLEVLNV